MRAGLTAKVSITCAGVIDSNTTPLWDFMDRTLVRGLVQEHLDGKQNRRLLIWSLLNVDELLKAYRSA